MVCGLSQLSNVYFYDQAKGLKVTCILSYCSEGDNIPDSFQLADAACKLLSLNPSEFSGMFFLLH